MELQLPSVLAQLPRPLQASGGRIHVGEVYGFAGSKKRKRNEVAVTIDGEAVNIYNVQSPKLVTSYAIPPQSFFSCRPCSVRRKLRSKQGTERQTYCASERPELQIKCFFEETSSLTAVAPVITTKSLTLKDSKSPIVFLDMISRNAKSEIGSDGFDLLAVHKDGRIRRLAADLTAERWSVLPTQVSNLTLSGYQVVSAFLSDLDDAQKSLFKRRRDLAALAVGDSPQVGSASTSILLLVTCPSNSANISFSELKIHIFSLTSPLQSTQLGLDDSRRLRYIHCIDFPQFEFTSELGSQDLEWNYHPSSACLQINSQRGYLNFDLSQYSPTVTSKLWDDDGDFSSVMRVSPYTVIGAGRSVVALYDTRYRSIQRSLSVSDINTTSSLKSGNREAPIVFVGYFTKLGIALATKGNTLLGFDLSTLYVNYGTSLKRQRDGLLVNAIGRGMISSKQIWEIDESNHKAQDLSALGLTAENEVARWIKFRKDIENASAAADAVAFDGAVTTYFKLSKDSPEPSKLINPEQLSYVLSKIFSVEKPSGLSERRSLADATFDLSVTIWPRLTCEWLLRTGQLNSSRIEVALRRKFMPHILPPIRSGSLVRLLSDYDPTLDLLQRFLRQPICLSPEDVTHALKVFLDRARSCSAAMDDAGAMTITGDAHDGANVPHSQTTTALQLKSSTGLEGAFFGLNMVLTKLHAFDSEEIVKSFRAVLSNTDTLSVIHHLRVSLATGGYTSRLSETPPVPIDAVKAAPPMSLDIIVDLLNVCVDAIGPSGWISAIGFAGSAANELDMIAHMKSEVSAALAGVEEASYISGVLREFVRYSNTVTTSTASQQSTTARKNAATAIPNGLPPHVKLQTLNGAQLVTYNPARYEDGFGDSSGKMLPLSLKAPSAADSGADGKGYRSAEGPTTVDGISLKKVHLSTGKQKKRSSREINYLRRQAVGKYSFERLIV